MHAMPAVRLWLAGLLALATACGGDSPTAPQAPPPPPGPGPGPTPAVLNLTGVPTALSPGGSAQLKAEFSLSNGTTRECAAAWSVDDARVATVSSSGLLTAVALGYFSVSASCEGLSAKGDSKVETVSPYKVNIVPFDSEVPTEYGVAAKMEFLDGPRAGQTMETIDTLINNGLPNLTWPVKVRFTAEDYEPREFIISEATGKRRNPTSNLYDFAIPMQFRAGGSTDTYIRTMSRSEMEITHPFTMAAAGSVRIRTWWTVDYNDHLTIDLLCGGRVLQTSTQRFGSSGDGFTHAVQDTGSCAVKLRQLKSDANTRYRIAISYPH